MREDDDPQAVEEREARSDAPLQEGKELTEKDPLAFNWQEDDQAADWENRDYSPPLSVKSASVGNIAIKEGEGKRNAVSVRTAQTSSNGWGVREDETGTLDAAGPPVVGLDTYNQRATGDVAHTLRDGEGGRTDVQPHVLAPEGDGADIPVDPKPDGPRYAALGDAITVNVSEYIGLRLVAALEREASSPSASLSE